MNQLTPALPRGHGSSAEFSPTTAVLTWLLSPCSPELSPDFSALFLEVLLQAKELEPEQLPPGTEMPLAAQGAGVCGLWVWSLCPCEQVAQGVSVAQLCLVACSRHPSAAVDVPGAAPGSVVAKRGFPR